MNKYLPYINFVLLIIIYGFFSWFFFFEGYSNNIFSFQKEEIGVNKESISEGCSKECREEIEKKVNESVSNIDLETKTIIEKETVKVVNATPFPETKDTQTVYLPITGPFGTTSTSWYDIPGTEFYLDYARDYGTDAYANWDVNLKIAHGNGTAYARLYDATNNIAVNGSEVSLSGNSDLEQISSGQLSFWNGRNLYRVQIKSLNGYEATFGSGRIKIRY